MQSKCTLVSYVVLMDPLYPCKMKYLPEALNADLSHPRFSKLSYCSRDLVFNVPVHGTPYIVILLILHT